MIKRGVAFCVLSLVLAGCGFFQKDEAYNALLAAHKVNHNPNGLAQAVKTECHRHVQELLQRETHPQSFTLYKDFVPLESATKAYMARKSKEEIPTYTVFYMAEYLGEDFAGNGVARRFVCNVRHDGYRFIVDGVGSDHGFAQRMQLPVDPPESWR